MRTLSLIVLLAFSVVLAGCREAATPTVNPEAILTQAASTVVAQLTLDAASRPTEAPTSTPAPTNTPVPPTATLAQPTLPPAATSTSAPTTAPTSAAQDAASFVADVTVPDGSPTLPGAVFDKTWRIKNSGVTTWSTSYSLVYIDGERMNAPEKVAMPREVKPGETVDITVSLTAPAKTGNYQAFFRLRNGSGQFFRLDGSGDLWVKISVGAAPTATATGAAAPTATP